MSESPSIKFQSRRSFLSKSMKAAGIAVVPPALVKPFYILEHWHRPNSLIDGVQIGVITYSYRSMLDQGAEAILQYILDSGISAIELMGDTAEQFAGIPNLPFDRATIRKVRRMNRQHDLSEDQKKQMEEVNAGMQSHASQVAEWRAKVDMDAFEALRKMYNSAGVDIFGFKPRALGKDNTDAEISYACKAAKALGASHLTVEIPSDDAHTERLGKLAAKHQMFVAYHGHLQQTPTVWDTALSQNKFNAMNPDFGHYVAAGNTNALELLDAKHDRIMSAHLKDRKSKDNGQDNMAWGAGDTPLIEILQRMRDKNYPFPATIELEYPIPDGSNAVTEVAKCLEFCYLALKA